jgi:hypothetical protein
MSWVKLDDHANEHEKQIAAGGEACWLWACGLMYCNRQKKRTGFVPSKQVRMLFAGYTSLQAERLAKDLVAAGLWEPADGGFIVHDYHVYQPRPEVIDARVEAGRSGGVKSGESRRSKTEAKCEAKPKQSASGEFEAVASTQEIIPPRVHAGADARRVRDLGSGIGDPEQQEPAGKSARDPDDSSPEAELADTKTSVPPPAEPAAESGFDLSLRVWTELWGKSHKQIYRLPFDHGQGGDERTLQRVGQLALEYGPRAEEVLRHKARAYLADNTAWVADKRHPVRFLERDWNSFGEPVTKQPVSGPRKAAVAAPQLPAEEVRRHAAAALKGLTAGIGTGPKRSGST